MQGKSNWIGYECEGRLIGLLTYFVRYDVDYIPPNIRHIYFTKEFLLTENYEAIINSYLSKYMVTIECNIDTYKHLTPNMNAWAHIIYRIEDSIPFDLKDTDSIFIDKQVYNVLCFTKGTAYKVQPSDYSKDLV